MSVHGCAVEVLSCMRSVQLIPSKTKVNMVFADGRACFGGSGIEYSEKVYPGAWIEFVNTLGGVSRYMPWACTTKQTSSEG